LQRNIVKGVAGEMSAVRVTQKENKERTEVVQVDGKNRLDASKRKMGGAGVER